MAEKPNYKQISALLDWADQRDLALRAMLDAQAAEVSALRKTAEEFYSQKFSRELESMDVELLAQGKQGIRVASLRSAGIANIRQLAACSVPQLEALEGIQLEDGLFPAATVDNLSTGFGLFDGSPWEYGTAPHIAPTAWFVMAINGFNPYSFDH